MECNDSVVAVASEIPRTNLLMPDEYKTYRHAPPHLASPGATYMITAATLGKKKLFSTDALLVLLENALTSTFDRRGWHRLAHVVLPNHYHVLAGAPDASAPIAATVADVHRFSARALNRLRTTPGRKVWWNYWDTCITAERSMMARLNYIHQNPVRHGYVLSADNWTFSSYRTFHENDPGAAELIESRFPYDKIKVRDDF